MKRLLNNVAICLVLALSGCWVTSVHPLYTDETLTVDPDVLGLWSDGRSTLAIISDEDSSGYWLIYADGNDISKHQGYLVRLGESLYLDTRLVGCDPFANEYIHHELLRVRWDDEVMLIDAINYDWLKGRLDAEEIDFDHFVYDDGIVITETTRDLQKLIMSIAEADSGFKEDLRLLRMN